MTSPISSPCALLLAFWLLLLHGYCCCMVIAVAWLLLLHGYCADRRAPIGRLRSTAAAGIRLASTAKLTVRRIGGAVAVVRLTAATALRRATG
jgi:hypothetical protein